jgi:hypothetical protein
LLGVVSIPVDRCVRHGRTHGELVAAASAVSIDDLAQAA